MLLNILTEIIWTPPVKEEDDKKKRKPREPGMGIIRYLCLIVFASSFSTALMLLNVHLSQTEEHINRIKSARPQLDLDALRKIKNGKLYNIDAFKRPTIIKKLVPSGSYLLPILPIDVGPNNLFRVFKQSMPIAFEMNYTLAMPVFHSHPRMEKWIEHGDVVDDAANTNHRPHAVWVPIFKTLYESELIYDPAKSFDMELLASKLPVVDHDTFVKECNNMIEYVVECGDLDPKRTAGFRVRN